MDDSKRCFVIIPFGQKRVGNRNVDFDGIYDAILAPAIRAVPLPEGGALIPHRADRDLFTDQMRLETYQLLEYARVVLADLTGLPANLFYILTVRHRSRQNGLVLLRQTSAPTPFDLNNIKALFYDPGCEMMAQEARAFVTQVLTDSLQQNRSDVPIQMALQTQRSDPKIERLLWEAENALINLDRATAIAKYRVAIETTPTNPLLRLKLGLLLKEKREWERALTELTLAVADAPTYSEAQRERGIVENKIYHRRGRSPNDPDGQKALLRAIELNPTDFEALTALGSILKKKGALKEALSFYMLATAASEGHPYPLLKELKLKAALAGALTLDPRQQLQLKRAEIALRAQMTNEPPYNVPWSCFDLAEVCLYQGNGAEFLQWIEKGIAYSAHGWQANTFLNRLQLLVDHQVELPGLKEGVAALNQRILALM